MSTSRVYKIVASLSSRFGIQDWDCRGWSELALEGGIAMDAAAFAALAAVAKRHGDEKATAYEIETLENDLAPISIALDYESFRELKGVALSHFESALVPDSKRWIALLTVDLETLVFGASDFLEEVASEVRKGGRK